MTDTPRTLSRQQAAEYLGLTPAGFDVWVRKGILPPPIAGTRRWDRKAIDAALDKSSGLAEQSDEDPFEKWKRESGQQEHWSHRTDSGAYVRSIELPTWSEASLKAPLGKREIIALSQIHALTAAGRNATAENISGAGLSTLSKLGARGLLEPDGAWYKMRLSPKGLDAYRALHPAKK